MSRALLMLEHRRRSDRKPEAPRPLATRARAFRRAKARTRRTFKNVFAGLIALTIGCCAVAFVQHASVFESESVLEHAHRRLSAASSGECNYQEVHVIMVLPYLVVILYAFLALAIVCDTFFEPSLEQISEKLDLSEDVAGATFMAAGSSAPELFTSVADTFGSQTSIGVGTIVGSALFNILIIVAMSAAVTPKAIKLDWRPVVRDVSWYLVAIGLFVLFITNGTECTYENNEGEVIIANDTEVADSRNSTGNSTDYTNWNCDNGVVYSYEGAILVLAYCGYIVFMIFNSTILNRCSKNVIKVHDAGEEQQQQQQQGDDQQQTDQQDAKNDNQIAKADAGADNSGGDDGDDDDEGPWWEIPDSIPGKCYFFLSLPLLILFHLTIPNCADEESRFHRWFVATFLMSILWIGAACHVAVLLANEIGCILGIDSVIMGLILLAAGTSVPDMIASMLVAKQGHADMAIANAVGSNVFDILLGLGLPWAFAESVRGTPVVVQTANIVPEIVILLGTVVLYVGTLILNRWTMEKKIGVVFVVIYFGYMLYAIIVETAVQDDAR